MIGSRKQLISYSCKGDSEHIGPTLKKDEVIFDEPLANTIGIRHPPFTGPILWPSNG